MAQPITDTDTRVLVLVLVLAGPSNQTQPMIPANSHTCIPGSIPSHFAAWGCQAETLAGLGTPMGEPLLCRTACINLYHGVPELVSWCPMPAPVGLWSGSMVRNREH